MDDKLKLAGVLLAGYALGRTKQMKLALAVAGFAAGKKFSGSEGGGMLSGIGQQLQSSPDIERLKKQSGTLAESAKDAAVFAATKGVSTLSSTLQESAEKGASTLNSTAKDSTEGLRGSGQESVEGTAEAVEGAAEATKGVAKVAAQAAGGAEDPEASEDTGSDGEADQGTAEDEAPARPARKTKAPARNRQKPSTTKRGGSRDE